MKNEWNEQDYYDWFDTYEPDFWFQLSKDKSATNGQERSLLYRLGKLAAKGDHPTVKQLKWAKEIVERVKSGEPRENNLKESIKSKQLMSKPEAGLSRWHECRSPIVEIVIRGAECSTI